jgi:metacaspase-1
MRKALCVGINDYPGRNNDLRGCVNDARAWARVLTEHYAFPSGDVRLLLDKAAKKDGVLRGLDSLLAGAKKGDVLVLTISSHGTYVADTSGDEERYDEAICPWDMKTNLIVDDELRQRFANLPTGCRFTVVSDSCFSGTVTRAPEIPTPDDRRKRFVRPSVLGLPELSDVDMAKPNRRLFPESGMREVLISGCNDHQESIDAKFGSIYHGAMTYFALDILRAAGYRITYQAFWDEIVVRLEDEGFDQEPQVEGKASAKRRLVFS